MKTHEEDVPLPQASRSQVVRDMFIFQAKLFLDGIKDVFLSPASLIAGLMGIAFGRKNPGLPLYEVLRFGKRLEGWVNLFSAAYPADKDLHDEPKESDEDSVKHEESAKLAPADFDSLVDRLQATLSDAESRSELSEKSKSTLVAITKRLRREQDQEHE